MAAENQGQGQQAQQQGGAPAAQGGSAGGSGNEGWSMPEKFQGKSAEEVARAYSELERNYGQAQQYKTVYDQIQQYGGLDNLTGWVNYGMHAYEQAQRSQQQPQPQQTPQTHQEARAWWSDWDTLTPAEQAQRLVQQSVNPVVGYVNQIATNFAGQLQQWQEQQVRQNDVYRQVLEAKLANPNLDINSTLAQMLAQAQANPRQLLDMVVRSQTAPAEIEREAQRRFEAMKADWELKQRNQQMGQVNGVTRQGYQVPQAPTTKGEENQNILRTLLEKGMISPGQV